MSDSISSSVGLRLRFCMAVMSSRLEIVPEPSLSNMLKAFLKSSTSSFVRNSMMTSGIESVLLIYVVSQLRTIAI